MYGGFDVTRLQVRELAKARGMTISDLSRRTEMAYTTTHALWHDSSERWNRKTLDNVARALGVRVRDLFADEQPPP